VTARADDAEGDRKDSRGDKMLRIQSTSAGKKFGDLNPNEQADDQHHPIAEDGPIEDRKGE